MGFIYLNSNMDRLDSNADLEDGRAFKIRMDAIASPPAALNYGCWAPGIYPYRNYASGAPSNWNGFMLCVKVPYGAENATSRWIKVAFEYGGDVYLLAQETDGSGTWKKIGGA